jgi:hypothetical protein
MWFVICIAYAKQTGLSSPPFGFSPSWDFAPAIQEARNLVRSSLVATEMSCACNIMSNKHESSRDVRRLFVAILLEVEKKYYV